MKMMESYNRTPNRVEFTLLGVKNSLQEIKIVDTNLPLTAIVGKTSIDMSESALALLNYNKHNLKVIKIRVSYIIGDPKRTICRIYPVGWSVRAPAEVWVHGFPAYRREDDSLANLSATRIIADRLTTHGIVVSREESSLLINPFASGLVNLEIPITTTDVNQPVIPDATKSPTASPSLSEAESDQ